MLFLKHKSFFGSLPISAEMYTFDRENNNLPFFATELPNNENALMAFHEHNHDDPEFIFITEGHLYTTINGHKYEFAKGDILCISPYDIHSGYVHGNERSEYICVQVSLSYIPGMTSTSSTIISDIKHGKLRFPIKLSSSNAHLAEIGALMIKLYSIKNNTDIQSEFESLASILLILSTLIGIAGLEPNTSTSKDMLFISKVTDYVELNYMNAVSTNDVANKLGYKPSYFCSLFRKNFDEPFVVFLNRYRVNKAIMLMEQSEEKLSYIARNVGFSDYKYFNRCFKKYVGITPAKYHNNKI